MSEISEEEYQRAMTLVNRYSANRQEIENKKQDALAPLMINKWYQDMTYSDKDGFAKYMKVTSFDVKHRRINYTELVFYTDGIPHISITYTDVAIAVDSVEEGRYWKWKEVEKREPIDRLFLELKRFGLTYG